MSIQCVSELLTSLLVVARASERSEDAAGRRTCPAPADHGDLSAALIRPDGIVAWAAPGPARRHRSSGDRAAHLARRTAHAYAERPTR
ncbi:hypothetical protein [Streptomyces sp. LN699]|uniref:aromatic-ring hydroxylase C-terminal domain-containing protein n=1 Tax=Streptomyces sp. LN699 TaxID=3112981 RepID=UPI00371ED87F